MTTTKELQPLFNGKDVIVVASSFFKEIGGSCVNSNHITREITKRGNKVLFVESLGVIRFPDIKKKLMVQKTFDRLYKFIKLLILGPSNPEKNLYVLSLIRIPFEEIPAIKRFNEKLISYFINRYSEKYLSPKPILWVFLPTCSFMKRSISNSLFVYHCVDNYAAIPNVVKHFIIEQERKTLKVSDLSFTVAVKRAKTLKDIAANEVMYLHNVVNFEYFDKIRRETFSAPQDLQKIMDLGKPIIGFVGFLMPWKENFPLLLELAKISPEYSFVFIGPLYELKDFRNIPNIFLLGKKEYGQIYKYLKYFDIGLVPRLINEASEGGFPLKYFEYLSAGMPTIITGIGSVKEYSALNVLGGVANTPKEFKERIDYWIKLKKSNPKEYAKGVEARIKIAKENSWEKRIKELDTLITKKLSS